MNTFYYVKGENYSANFRHNYMPVTKQQTDKKLQENGKNLKIRTLICLVLKINKYLNRLCVFILFFSEHWQAPLFQIFF